MRWTPRRSRLIAWQNTSRVATSKKSQTLLWPTNKSWWMTRLYLFNTLYQIRRILEEMHIALPGDKAYSWYEYDSRAFKRLCAEFGVSPDNNWRQNIDHENQE
ncbi:MAG: hypothetical protein AB2693_31700 [Candidatus Thiodiazotropha sp.]